MKREKLIEKLSHSINELELPARPHNRIVNAGVKTIGDLVQKKESDLLKLEGFGIGSLLEVNIALHYIKLELDMKLSKAEKDELARIQHNNPVEAWPPFTIEIN